MIKNWIEDNLLDVQWIDDNVFEIINIGRFLVVSEKDIVFDQEMDLILDHGEESIDIDFYCFKFGEQYYYTDSIKIKKLKPLKYLGKYRDELQISNPPFLGIHGGYELLNGSRIYIDWIQKAKFLDINTLGIVEKNTLAGVLKFQLACQDNNITPIIGEQVVVKDGDDLLQFKCYVKNEIGWKNLLTINKIINIVNHGFILRGDFLNLVEGISVVVDCKYTPYNKIRTYHSTISDLYYQIDSVEFKNNEKDQEYLLNLQKFVKQKDIKPVLISDAYYLDKSDIDAKSILNNISNVRDFKSEDQYFKTIEDNYSSLSSLFSDENEFIEVFGDALNNVIELSKECVFQIQTDIKYLPEYLMTDEEVEKYGDKETMFWALVEEGLKNKIKDDDLDKYLDRINEEYDTISLVQSEFGNGVDYFLISQDIVKYCNENNILVGLGRGSAAGSFLAYLLDITKINPFDYDLLFSRFLNKGRVEKGSLPDVDLDFEGLKRSKVKHYLEEKYGQDNVCSVGTYTTLQLRAAFKDIARQRGIDHKTANFISEGIDTDRGDWVDVFKLAQEKQPLKNFILRHPDIIEDIQLILKQPRSASVHACAMIITPQNKTIYEYIPVRIGEKDGEEIIVSEWEGGELEKAGFLKEDILGIRQLDKYSFILDLIKKQTGENVSIYDTPLDVDGVYELFQQGNNGDVFHFGSHGLTQYCKELKPETIHDLIAGIALYRPGSMEINSHNEYIFRKEGSSPISYRWGTEEILKDTYGLIVYQEQVMKIVSQLADFSLIDADEIRRAMGKKIKDVIDKYEDQFISKVIEKGCPEDEAKTIWHELEVQSKYTFNRSHAASYAITGYIGQWLKYHYPLQYWTAAFQFDDPNPKKSNLGRYISEIRRTDNFIKIMPPEINESGETFTSNYEKMELYWSITRVKQLGEKALQSIMEERNKNGEFFSLEDFLNRTEKRVVNKAVVINLILSGSFDAIENIKIERDRKILINKYYEFSGTKRDKEDEFLLDHPNYWWQIKQKEICGFGDIDYKTVITENTKLLGDYCEGYQIKDLSENKKIIVAGMIKDFTIKTTKKDDEYCKLILDCNNEDVDVMVWNESYRNIPEEEFQTGRIFIMFGSIAEYRGNKSVHSYEESEIYFLN